MGLNLRFCRWVAGFGCGGLGGPVCRLILGRRPGESCHWWALPFHSAHRAVAAQDGSELFFCPLLYSCRSLVAFLDTSGEQLRRWWLSFDDHLGVVSLDNDADGSWERINRRAVVALTFAGVVGLGVLTGSTAFHCHDLPNCSLCQSNVCILRNQNLDMQSKSLLQLYVEPQKA